MSSASLTSACALIVISSVFLLTTFLVVRRSVHTDLLAQAAIVADNSTAALSFEDPYAATETLQALRAKASIDLACVYSRYGALFAESRRAESVQPCPGKAPPDLDEMTLDAVRVTRPVMLGPRRIGTLYLLGNLNAVWQRMAIQTAAAVGGILLASLVAFIIARHLQELIAEAGRHARGDGQRDLDRAATIRCARPGRATTKSGRSSTPSTRWSARCSAARPSGPRCCAASRRRTG